MSVQADIEQFLDTYESEHTRRAYHRHLRTAFEYLPVSSVYQLDSSHLAGYGLTWSGTAEDRRATHRLYRR